MIERLAADRSARPRHPLSPQLRQGGGPRRPASRRPAASCVITLDADLQDDPAEIPRFLAEIDKRLRRRQRLEAGAPRPVAQGWPVAGVQLAGRPADRRPAARPQLRLQVLPPRDLREVRLYGELHRFVPVLAAARGLRVGEIVVNHRPRKFGRSKYGVHADSSKAFSTC